MLSKYKTLLFDADDTLLDFGTSEKIALHSLFKEQKIKLTDEIETRYKEINQELWGNFEEGKLSYDQVVNTRFATLFKEYAQEVDGVLFEQKYRSYLNDGHDLVDGAVELITNLQNKYDLYIITNGIANMQDKRLRDSGLYSLFKGVFISEASGYQKPMKEYFDYVFARIPNFSIDQTLIIGDSLTSDIKGGYLAGIDTCWFNSGMKENNSGIVPTYEIKKLDELYGVLDR